MAEPPVSLEMERVGGAFILQARWHDGEREHTLPLRAASSEAALDVFRLEIEVLLGFCYQAGTDDASNPRFFVP